MIVPAVETVVSVVIIAMLAAVSVFMTISAVIKRMIIMVSVMLVPGGSIITAPARPNTVLIMMVMMWKIVIFLTIAIIIVIRSFAIIVSMHNEISAAIGSIAGIIRILLRIVGTGGKQHSTDEQRFFSDRFHFIAHDD